MKHWKLIALFLTLALCTVGVALAAPGKSAKPHGKKAAATTRSHATKAAPAKAKAAVKAKAAAETETPGEAPGSEVDSVESAATDGNHDCSPENQGGCAPGESP